VLGIVADNFFFFLFSSSNLFPDLKKLLWHDFREFNPHILSSLGRIGELRKKSVIFNPNKFCDLFHYFSKTEKNSTKYSFRIVPQLILDEHGVSLKTGIHGIGHRSTS